MRRRLACLFWLGGLLAAGAAAAEALQSGTVGRPPPSGATAQTAQTAQSAQTGAGSSPVAQLEAYDQALDALREGRAGDAVPLLEGLVRRMPAHAGAWLDLGIALCDLGRARDAEQVFRHIEARFDPGPAIREVIGLYRRSGCAPRALGAARPAWEFRVGGGYTSNVNQGISDLTVEYGPAGQSVPLQLSDDFRPHGAGFGSLDVFHRRPLDEDGDWQWDTGLRLRRHTRLPEYDTALLFTGVNRRWSAAGWRGDLQLGLSQLWLGSRSYQQGLGLGAAAWRPLAPGWAGGLELDAFTYRYPSLRRYDNEQWSGQLRLRRFGAGWQLTAGLGWLQDLADDRPGGNRSGPLASLRWQALPMEGLSLDFALAWRRLDDSGPYNPLLWAGAVRSQRQWTAQLAAEYRLAPRDALRMELNRVDTRDTLPIFAWSGTSLGLTWIRTLPGR